MKKSPICFIAMAFGWDDTDAFYEKQILPTLKRNGIKPIIINRHQSNDDLNFQIFEQLNKADFCIADLTYTRPSVYFEAGYAQRAIPVIYTVRKDHLGKGQPDDLRVHFDLQMKPIVVWSSQNDATFSNRLEKRLIATVLRDWKLRQKKDEKLEAEGKRFQQLPQFSKLSRLRRLVLYETRKVGVKLSSWQKEVFHFDSGTGGGNSRQSIVNGHVDHLVSSIKKKNKILQISLQAYNSLNKKDLYDLQNAYFGGVFGDELARKYKKSPILVHNIVLSLRPITSNQIESVFRVFSPVIKSKRYVNKFTATHFDPSEIPDRSVINTFHFLSGIESESQLKELLKEILDVYIPEQLG